MKAAILAIRGEFPKQVSVLSPQRKEIVIPVESASAEGTVGTATCIKDAGDDLDCTNGTPIVVTVELTDTRKGSRYRNQTRTAGQDRKACNQSGPADHAPLCF